MDAGADAAVDADGTTRTVAGKDGITAITTSPPNRSHSSVTTTTTTAGAAATTSKIGTQAGHAHQPSDTRDTRRQRTRTTPWADRPEASTRRSTATTQGTRAMHSGWHRDNKDKLLTTKHQRWLRPRWQRLRWQRRRCRRIGRDSAHNQVPTTSFKILWQIQTPTCTCSNQQEIRAITKE